MSEKNPIQAVDRKHALLVWADTVDAFNARLGNALDELQEAGFPSKTWRSEPATRALAP